RARDAAEREDRTLDWWKMHPAADSPERTRPAPRAELAFEALVLRRNRDNAGASCCVSVFAQISRRQQMIVPIFAIEEQDVELPGQLAMLKPVVENVDARRRTGRRL